MDQAIAECDATDVPEAGARHCNRYSKKEASPDVAVFDAYRDFVDFRGPNYKGSLCDIATRNYQLARERKDPENALVAFERYSATTKCATVSGLFSGMEESFEMLLRLGVNGLKRLRRIYGEEVAPMLVAMSIEYPAHIREIVRSLSEEMAARVSLPPSVERPTIHGSTLPNTPEEWCNEPLLTSSLSLSLSTFLGYYARHKCRTANILDVVLFC